MANLLTRRFSASKRASGTWLVLGSLLVLALISYAPQVAAVSIPSAATTSVPAVPAPPTPPTPSAPAVTATAATAAPSSAATPDSGRPVSKPESTGPAKEVTVLVKPVEPFVIGEAAEGSVPAGFSVDLWNAIAQRSNFTTKWIWTDTVTNQINGVAEKKADVAIGAITMTPEREAKIDFSLRMFSSSLGILATEESNRTSSFLSVIFTPQLAKALQVVGGAVVVFSVVVFLVRRRQDDFPRGIVRGLGQSLWLSGQAVAGGELSTVFTRGEAPTKLFGRVLYLIWLWLAILLAAYIGGAITSVMTVEQLKSGISGPQDLINFKTVAPDGTTSSSSLTDLGIGHSVVPTYQEGLVELQAGTFEAMVFDRPVLQYWLQENPTNQLSLVGTQFGAEPYGFALQPQSPLRDQINLALLQISDDGTYDRIYEAWFGSPPVDGAG